MTLGRLDTSVAGNVIAGAIAMVIYATIAIASGASLRWAVGVGLLLGLFTVVVSFVITNIISARKRAIH